MMDEENDTPIAPATEKEEAPTAPEEKEPELAAADTSVAGTDDDGEMTREAFDKWLEDATNAKMSATVSEPTVIKSGTFGGLTYGYKVSCSSLGSDLGVWRRYSDFEWLYTVLSSRYSGTIFAPMPEKKLLNSSPAFLDKRCRQLGAWLMLTLQNPYVKRDATMHEFLTSTQVDKEWDELKKLSLAEAKIPWLDRENCRHWRYYLTNCLDLPNDEGEVLAGLWASVTTQLGVVGRCLSSLNTVDQRQRALSVAICTAGDKAESLGFTTSPT